MNKRMLGYLIGIILAVEASLLSVPLITALIYRESTLPFIITMGILIFVSLPMIALKPKNPSERRIFAKEGFVCVAAAWIFLSVFGALPFVISGSIPNYVDALFETVSGFTTTGATILTEIESLPKGILLWRSFTHWIGGMGVLVFVLALLPQKDGRSIHLLRAEVPGPTKGKLVPKLRKTALILYGIYIALTVIMVICLLFTKMSLYDSLVNSFATAGTGGFSVKNASIGSYANPAAEWVIGIFMLVFGINFNLLFFLIVGQFASILKNEELRVYVATVLISTALISVNIFKTVSSASDCIRSAFFQVTSIISTTGFSSIDYSIWPSFSTSILILLTVIGACAGSTAGGLKISRVILVIKNFARELRHKINPKSVNVVKMDGEPMLEETIRSAANYITAYITIIFVCFLTISLDGFDFETNFTAALTCMNNVGPGLGAVGPAGNFSAYSYLSKIVLSLTMLIGRLEIVPLMILFAPSTYRKK